jgi:hypothetical protein
MYKIKTFNQIAVKGPRALSAGPVRGISDSADPDAVLLRSHKLTG